MKTVTETALKSLTAGVAFGTSVIWSNALLCLIDTIASHLYKKASASRACSGVPYWMLLLEAVIFTIICACIATISVKKLNQNAKASETKIIPETQEIGHENIPYLPPFISINIQKCK